MSARTDHQKPNIVLIMTDQQRADTIAELGHPWMQTPNLDRLVKQGTSFTNCFVTSPVCVSSRASVFLGAYPHTTNVYTNFETWQPNWVRLACTGRLSLCQYWQDAHQPLRCQRRFSPTVFC